MSQSRGNNPLVDLLPEEQLNKAEQPRYHVDYFRKKYPFTSRLFTAKEQAKIVAKHMQEADTLAAMQKHRGLSSSTLFSEDKPKIYCDEASWKKLAAKK